MVRDIQHKKGKVYYSMGEVSEMFDVNPSLIRFWEQKFDILRPHKNKKGNRMFTPEDVDNFKLIYHLVKERGLKLDAAQKWIKANRGGTQRDVELMDRLLKIRSLLAEIRQELKGDPDAVVSLYDDSEESEAERTVSVPIEKPGRKSFKSKAVSEVETMPAEERVLLEELDSVSGFGGESMSGEESLPSVPFEQPLLPDESFAIAAMPSGDVFEEDEVPEPAPEAPAQEKPKAQPTIIEQTLF